MDKRAQRMGRLLDVLTQLHRIEEQKKYELQRRYDELQRSQRDIIFALDTDEALHGIFIDTSARRLRNLAKEAQGVAEARDRQSRKLLDRATKVKTAEKIKDTLDQQTGRARQEAELRDIIERYVGRKSASLP